MHYVLINFTTLRQHELHYLLSGTSGSYCWLLWAHIARAASSPTSPATLRHSHTALPTPPLELVVSVMSSRGDMECWEPSTVRRNLLLEDVWSRGRKEGRKGEGVGRGQGEMWEMYMHCRGGKRMYYRGGRYIIIMYYRGVCGQMSSSKNVYCFLWVYYSYRRAPKIHVFALYFWCRTIHATATALHINS